MTFRDTELDKAIAKDILPPDWKIKEFNKNKAAEKVDEINTNTEIKILKNQLKEIRSSFKEIGKAVGNLKFVSWQNELRIRKENKDTDILKQKLKENELELSKAYVQLKDSYFSIIDQYMTILYTINAASNKEVTKSSDDVWKLIFVFGENYFAYLKKKYFDMIKKALKLSKQKSLTNFNIDKINQELAQIPLKIEEKIDDILDKLDIILGKKLANIMNPKSVEFDISVIEAKIKALIDPLLAAASPLESLVGPIPVLGDLIGMMGQTETMGSISKEDLRKMVPTVEIPGNLMETVKNITYDIMVLCMTLPTLLIDAIVQMINVIYSKLEIITNTIPLGNLYPLNLIKGIIQFLPQLYPLMKQLPALIEAWVQGKIKDKLRESIALGIPKSNVDVDLMKSLIEEALANKASKKSKPDEKKIDYQDVNKEVYESIKSNGYLMRDLDNVLKSFKKIHNDMKPPLTLYKPGPYNKDGDLTVVHGQQTREKQTPEQYKEYLNGQISESNIKDELKYIDYDRTDRICAPLYQALKDMITEQDHIAVERKIKPSLTGKLIFGGDKK